MNIAILLLLLKALLQYYYKCKFLSSVQFFNATRQLSHIEAAPCKFLVVVVVVVRIFNATRHPRHIEAAAQVPVAMLL